VIVIVIAGVEIKPGKPFTHTYDSFKGRLHISMVIFHCMFYFTMNLPFYCYLHRDFIEAFMLLSRSLWV